ncbi:MAG: hypothetical protein HUJ93_04880 [Bacteroidales bacterium]|nr:hypothetical protein [Bacteroidales bacterium]
MVRLTAYFIGVLLQLLPILDYTKHNSAKITAGERVVFEELTELPSVEGAPNPGLAGAFAGKVGEKLIVAGGANFPDIDGPKVYQRDLYVYSGGAWMVYEDFLPEGIAYGASVALKDGLLCVGGCNDEKCFADVFMIRFVNGEPRITNWNPLWYPLANAAYAVMDNKLYLAGGIHSVKNQQSVAGFYVLDLKTRHCEILDAWPGESRAFGVGVSQGGCFYLFSGRTVDCDNWTGLDDGFKYNPQSGEWTPLGGGFEVMAGLAVPFGNNRILFLGGRDVNNKNDRMLRLYNTYTEEIALIDVPDRVDIPVTSTIVKGDKAGEYIAVSGEVAPRIRTPKLLKVKISNR